LSCKFVIGEGAQLDWVVAAWREAAPSLEIVAVALADGDEAAQDAAIETALAAADAGDSAFVSVGPERLNLRRLELMALVKSRGLAMPPLICRGAVVAATASLSENCFVGAGAVIGAGCRIGYNSVIGAGALIGSGCDVGQSVYVDDGAQLGRAVNLAGHVTIGMGVLLAHGVKVGKFSIIDKPGSYQADIAARTFIHAGHARPIIVVGG